MPFFERTSTKLQRQLTELSAAHVRRDRVLDYVFRFYQLDIASPWVKRPGFDERRCFHCHYPEGHHDAQCPWLAVAQLRKELYDR